MITPEDLYTLYYLSYIFETNPNKVQQFRYVGYLNRMKNTYIMAFMGVLKRQIVKYVSAGRMDSEYLNLTPEQIEDTYSVSVLKNLMAHSYRSDMKRRNSRWNILADLLEQLSITDNDQPEKMAHYMKLINQTAHNTDELMFAKFKTRDRGQSLIKALNNIHQFKDPEDFKHLADQEILNTVLNERRNYFERLFDSMLLECFNI